MNLNPHWIAGFVDGEGTFYVGINKHPEMTTGYQVMPEFRVVQHKRDIQLLHALKKYFKGGVVRVNHDDRYEFRVRNLQVLHDIIVPFFEKYDLCTKKKLDFIKFRKIIRYMNQKKHLTREGIIDIIRIAKQMNRGYKPIAEKIEEELSNG